MDTDKFKSIALNMDSYKQLRELSDEMFEMPQSMARTASYFINKAHEEFKKNKNGKSKS